MNSLNIWSGIRKSSLLLTALFFTLFAHAQTNVYDDIIATSSDHTSLAAALTTAGLEGALQNDDATLTVFAPTNEAFDNLATALGTDIDGLLALPNLGDILLYHVLGVTAQSGDLNNGDIVTPLNDVNTVKLTVTSMGMVYANQSLVSTPDINADNGVVHSMDAVLLPSETVVDVAIDNGFTSLTAAVVTAELLPALTDPLATLTVFAPSNMAFDNLATALGTDIDGLLALPNLAEILTYHVLGTTALSTDLSNGDIVTPLNDANTIKLTVTGGGMVFANQAMVELADLEVENGVVHAIDAVILDSETVVDVAIDNGFTSLTAAVVTAELLPALTDPLATLTVFAPSNMAFDNLATALGTDIDGLLALPNLAEILTYHVLGTTALSTDLSNGDIVTPLNNANTIKLTVTAGGIVYANQAMVELADLEVENGVVHVIDAVILDSETVVDVAIDNGFTSLTAAVVTAELLPALTDPLATLTVFAPSNMAFDNLATALGTDIDGLLALPNLAEILTYHVLGTTALSTDLSNGDIVTPLNNANTIKLTVTAGGIVYANQAMVELADLNVDNGVVHAIDAVILESETVVDVAIDNGFTTLAAAVITAELLPALTDPLASYTVFAPTNEAFDQLAADLGTDLDGILALPILSDVLLYHVIGEELASGDLMAGPLATLAGVDVNVDLMNGVMINTATVTLANQGADNGVVHVINEVLFDETLSVQEYDNNLIQIFPNPTSDFVVLRAIDAEFNEMSLINMEGKIVLQKQVQGPETRLNVQGVAPGIYMIRAEGKTAAAVSRLVIN